VLCRRTLAVESQTRIHRYNNTEEGKISLEMRYRGACLFASSNGGDIRRAIAQADEVADLYEQIWENRLARLEKERVKSLIERSGIRKTWSLGIQFITGERRRDRAASKFKQYCEWAHINRVVLSSRAEDPITGNQIPITRGLNDWREQGFVDGELDYLKEDFERFKKIALQAKSDKSTPQAVKPLPFR
jgi:hypothetical protein